MTYFTGYNEQVYWSSYSHNIHVAIHYSVNGDCTHNIYNNTYTYNTGSGSLNFYSADDENVGSPPAQVSGYSSLQDGNPLPYTFNFPNNQTHSTSTNWTGFDGFCGQPDNGNCDDPTNGSGSFTLKSH